MIYNYTNDDLKLKDTNEELNYRFKYIPIHLNVIFNGTYQKFKETYLTQELVDEIYKVIETEEIDQEIVILDFNNIMGVESRVFEKFKSFQGERYILFINLGTLCYKNIILTDLKDRITSEESLNIAYFNNSKDRIMSMFSTNNIEAEIENLKNRIVASYLYNNKEDNNSELESTPVKSNIYINIKAIFSSVKIYLLVIYILCEKINNSIELKDIKAFVSVNNNSAILSCLIGQILDKESLYLINLGPNITLKNRAIIDKLVAKKKYVLVFDFICLGTEYKLAKTILDIKEAKLELAVGVSSFINLEIKDKVKNIFLVNDENVVDFKYSICVTD